MNRPIGVRGTPISHWLTRTCALSSSYRRY